MVFGNDMHSSNESFEYIYHIFRVQREWNLTSVVYIFFTTIDDFSYFETQK